MIRLREINEQDLPIMKKWRNSERVNPYTREFRFLSDRDQAIWFENYTKMRRDSDWGQDLMMITADPADGFNAPVIQNEFGVFVRKKEVEIGVGGFTRIEWRNRKAELSLYFGVDYDEEIFAEVLENLFHHGFEILGMNKIVWPVYGHDPNLEMYQRAFVSEVILKDEYFWDGKFYDRHYLSILRSDYESL